MRRFSALKDRNRMHHNCWVVLFVCSLVTSFPHLALASFASRFSISAGEEYNDNIFFSDKKTHDFVTIITPVLHFLYRPEFRTNSLLTLDLSVPAEIYARRGAETNFGDRLSLRANYFYPYSRNLSFRISDCLGRVGETRLSGFDEARNGGFGDVGRLGGSLRGGDVGGSCGGGGGLSNLGRGESEAGLNTDELITGGETLTNQFEGSVHYLYSPNLTLSADYNWRYISFLDAGGKENSHTIGVNGSYQLWRLHNLFARYRVTILSPRGEQERTPDGQVRTRDDETTIIHDFDAGDDFLSSRQINLTPTLSIRGSTGLSMGTRKGSFDLRHKLEVTLVKLWQTAIFTVGAERKLTGSFGVSGPSYTTEFFGQYAIQLSRQLVGFAAASYGLYDADEVNFKTFQAIGGFQYWVTNWMSANLAYSYRRLNPDKDNRESDLLRSVTVDGNSVVLSVAMYFDIWPNIGLARSVAANAQLFGSPGLGGIGAQPSSAPQQPAGQAPSSNP